ncbi:MAG TPA: sulfurtransferase-like selenium metabolism protein YedF [Thermoanaerobacterales bacterium]|nr:sulfurtransferase-like selenium metabolism protein YedF [Thermoanaerobacterales bacterium]
MEKTVDARGLACPKPVLLTKKALEEIEEGNVLTIVDTEIARDNVIKLAKSMDCNIITEESNGSFYINISKKQPMELTDIFRSNESDYVLLVTSQFMGKGSEELGRVLINSFFYTLSESKNLPQCILFINSGVNLTTQKTSIIESLTFLESKGVEILSCGTCLDFYNLKDRLLIGGITNMYTIAEKLIEAAKVITI